MLYSRQLDAGIFSDDICHSGGHQSHGAVVIVAFQKGDRVAHEAAYFSVRQDALKSVSDFNSVAMVVNGKKNQYAAVAALLPDSPLCKQINRVTLDVAAIQVMNGNDRHFRVRFLVDLSADIVEGGLRFRAQHLREIIEVIGGMEL